MTKPSRRAVFLDRDGVLNRAIVQNGKPYPPASLAELVIFPDALKSLSALKERGFLLIGVTNQPDVARGTQHRRVVEAINAALLAALPLQEIYVCYHDDRDGCLCRKPLPGLLMQAAAKYSIALPFSFMIGDRWRDVEAGHRADCATILIDHGYEEKKAENPPDSTVHSLSEAAAWILSQSDAPKGAKTT